MAFEDEILRSDSQPSEVLSSPKRSPPLNESQRVGRIEVGFSAGAVSLANDATVLDVIGTVCVFVIVPAFTDSEI